MALSKLFAPSLRNLWGNKTSPGVSSVQFWSAVLTAIPALIAIALWRQSNPEIAITAGLILFGFIFAMNSSIHSYMVLAYTDKENVSLNVGFYYMANAAGRLIGTLYQEFYSCLELMPLYRNATMFILFKPICIYLIVD